MSTLEVVEEHSRVSWQECVDCGGVFMVWADPQAPPIHEHLNDFIRPEWFVYRSGIAPVEHEIIHCGDCYQWDYRSLLPTQRRWGPALPAPRPLEDADEPDDEAQQGYPAQ